MKFPRPRFLFATTNIFLWLFLPMGAMGDQNLPLLKLTAPCLVHFLASAKPLWTFPRPDERQGDVQLDIFHVHEISPNCMLVPTMTETLFFILQDKSDTFRHVLYQIPFNKKPKTIKLVHFPQYFWSNTDPDPYLLLEVPQANTSHGRSLQLYINFIEGFIKQKNHPNTEAVWPMQPLFRDALVHYYKMKQLQTVKASRVSLRQYEDREDKECSGAFKHCPRTRHCFALSDQNGREAAYCLPWAYGWSNLIWVKKNDISQPDLWLTLQATEAYIPTFTDQKDEDDWQGPYAKRQRTFSFTWKEGWISPP